MAPDAQAHVADPHVWVALLHAEVAHLLAEAGIPALHLKGPTVEQWLYAPGERPSGDVDVLVPPDLMQAALDALYARGFVDRYPGVNRRTSTDHAIALRRLDPALGLDEVDVHDRFEGLDRPAAEAFEVLWAHREPAELAHRRVWFPDLPSRAILICLNAARDSVATKPREDLRRLLASEVEWDLVVALGRRLGALPAMRAGLELADGGADLADRLGLGPVSAEWKLRVAAAPKTALRLDELRRTPWSRRAPLIGRWLVPAPAIIRMREPDLDPGWRPLAGAYTRRLGQGVRGLRDAVRALRRASGPASSCERGQ